MNLNISYKRLYRILNSKEVSELSLTTSNSFLDKNIEIELSANEPLIEKKQLSKIFINKGNFNIESFDIIYRDNLLELKDLHLISFTEKNICVERDMAPIYVLPGYNDMRKREYTNVYSYTFLCSKITNIVQNISSSFK